MTAYTDYKNRLGRNKESDECYTPSNSVAPLVPFLDLSRTYYEPTSGLSSHLADGLEASSVKVVKSYGKDFFDCTEEDVCDGIISNPPYSLKDKFIGRCYDLGKPFALLLPVTALQGQKRGSWFKDYGISLLVYNKRIDFTGKGSPPFGVAWFMGNGLCEHGRVWFTDHE